MEKIVRCEFCRNYHDGYCRHEDFVSWRMKDGQKVFKIHDVYRGLNDFCSYGEEGEYEPWGFEDDIQED